MDLGLLNCLFSIISRHVLCSTSACLAGSALCSSVKAMKDLLVISTLNVIQIRGTPSVKLKPTAKFMACLRDHLPSFMGMLNFLLVICDKGLGWCVFDGKFYIVRLQKTLERTYKV